ncbi:CAP domain-containing protein [Streptomyces sp. ISL-96]|uniref:CAP domain-containing protein n=1 Tax=Streptomyces sp. ISL-96 TaxID=2819191 RepID=UPI001BEB048F|nr:CAP domain-containing protein [Streptomyces sp. ISL-96]MBT2491055.1 CAP domain-containing protein [Streptomyces sp. ISL-96]
MGRHRRSAAGPVAADHADAPAGRYQGGARRRKKRAAPVRTGLLGVSAAVAMGAVAVASGLLPGGENYSFSGGSADQIRTEGPPELQPQGGTSVEPTDQTSSPAAEDTGRAQAPSKSPSPKPKAPQPTQPSEKPSAEPSAKPSERRTAAPDSRAKQPVAPEKSQSPKPDRVAPTPPARIPGLGNGNAAGSGSEATAEATVVALVNQERAAAGCAPVRADGPLAALAEDFSQDMAARGFFDHTDPDGATPWDRAEKAGISGLGGENIARGQADAQAVMDAWMNSEGHRANILNCDFKTLGVGVHMGPGGPWWTQNFGF